MASATLTTLVTQATTLASAVVEAARNDTYATRQEAEAACNAAREAIAAAVDQALEDEPITSEPLVRALRTTAARLLDVGRALKDALATIEITLTAERSLIDLAVELYNDGLRAEDLLALNRTLHNPLRISTGSKVVVYVS